MQVVQGEHSVVFENFAVLRRVPKGKTAVIHIPRLETWAIKPVLLCEDDVDAIQTETPRAALQEASVLRERSKSAVLPQSVALSAQDASPFRHSSRL